MINIKEIKNKLGNGCTDPYVVWCDDNKSYVVKFPGNEQGVKTLVNEFIASNLCEYLELPVFDYNLINVTIEDYNENIKKDIKPLKGTAFGTVYNDNAYVVLNSNRIIKSVNRNDAIKILIFDILIGNYDRNNGNLMIDEKSKKIYMIDHSHIFNLGTIWDEVQLSRLINENFEKDNLNPFNYNLMMEAIKINDEKFNKELAEFINKVKNIDKNFIINIMDNLPDDWNVTPKEKELLVKYIYNRFIRVDEVINILNLKGGESYEEKN